MMTLADFKVGDRVRVTADLSAAPDAGEQTDVLHSSDATVGIHKGYVSTVVAPDADAINKASVECIYITTPGGMKWAMYPEMLERIE